MCECVCECACVCVSVCMCVCVHVRLVLYVCICDTHDPEADFHAQIYEFQTHGHGYETVFPINEIISG